MKESKYKILWDYGSEGFKFHSGSKGDEQEYETINEAVKEAIGINYSSPFLIVKIIDWEAN